MTNNRRRWWMAGGLLVLGTQLVWAFVPRPHAVEAVQASRVPFEASIDEDGRTRIRDRYVVHAPLAGRLQRLVLREGDEVRAGDAGRLDGQRRLSAG